MFENLANFMTTLCILPHSSAAEERKFPDWIKTKFRNKLNGVTVNSLMLTGRWVEDKISTFVPSLELDQFLRKYKFA